jgi:tyrosyl-DNA phosphodiesterase-1
MIDHTKMMITIRHDDQAQIIITTANMIPADWTNMTQALWKSPLLPLLTGASRSDSNQVQGTNDAPFGSGLRFKFDFLNYLRAYNVQRRTMTLPLIEQLLKYDFSSIRGALVGHVPGKYPVEGNRTLFGWPAVKAILKTVTVSSKPDLKPEIVSQMSSIATLGPTTAWLMDTLFDSLNQSENDPGTGKKTKLSVVYPTPDEIRRSLDGYYSGGSIHMRIQSAAQQKQLQYMRPMMRHWAGDEHDRPESLKPVREAGRKRAAPHIKTYIRFADAQKTIIDWALVTSANLSKQAWGEKTNKDDMVRISSYELGVLVAPQFYGDNVVMVPTFQTDMPARPEGVPPEKVILGCRMPYDLPLVPYKPNEKPWCQTETHPEPDWRGLMWNIP